MAKHEKAGSPATQQPAAVPQQPAAPQEQPGLLQQMVEATNAEASTNTGDEIDEHLRAQGIIAQRVYRCTYNDKTPEGKIRSYRHRMIAASEIAPEKPTPGNEGWLGKEFKLVAATSYLCTKVFKGKDGQPTGEVKQLLRTVIETDKGELIACFSDFLFQSVCELHVLFGMSDFTKSPIRAKVQKFGRAYGVVALDLLEGKM